jgi:hypothetical protein
MYCPVWLFFSQNAWDGWCAWAYSLTYHLTSKIPEGIATAAVLMLLPVGRYPKAIGKEVLHANRFNNGLKKACRFWQECLTVRL